MKYTYFHFIFENCNPRCELLEATPSVGRGLIHYKALAKSISNRELWKILSFSGFPVYSIRVPPPFPPSSI